MAQTLDEAYKDGVVPSKGASFDITGIMDASVSHKTVRPYQKVSVHTRSDLRLTPPKMTTYFRFRHIHDSHDEMEFFEEMTKLRGAGATAVGISQRSLEEVSKEELDYLAEKTDYMIFRGSVVRVCPWEVDNHCKSISAAAAIAQLKAKYPQFRAGAKVEVYVFSSAIIHGMMQAVPLGFGRPTAYLRMCIEHAITRSIGWTYDGKAQADGADDDEEWVELEDAKALEGWVASK